MDPVTIAIAKSTAKQLSKLGKAGIKQLLQEPLVQAAATKTQQKFEEIEIRDGLIAWAKTDDFVQILANLKEGDAQEINLLVPEFIEGSGFYNGDQTQATAVYVLHVFLSEIIDQLYNSPNGRSILANRQEVLHNETKIHITAEVTKATDRIIENLSTPNVELSSNRTEKEFRYQTELAIKRARIAISGLKNSFHRDEIARIEDQLRLGNSVILKGEPGTGKTGIGRNLAENSVNNGKVVLFLDAKQFRRVTYEKELRERFESVEPLSTLIARLGRERGFRLIIDQIDNIVGLDAAKVLIDLAKDCNRLPGVEVVVIGRDRETHESDILQRIAEDGFVELESYPLTKEKAEESLKELGIPDPPQKLIDLSRNLLNLELIATIKLKQPNFDFSNILDEIALWDSYLHLLRRREEEGADLNAAEQTVTEAIRLAKLVVGREEQTFSLDSPLAAFHRRLESWGIIVKEEGLVYRFQHEQFQDYLFASDAVDHLKMPQEVMKEINFLRNRNIFLWMTKIYAHRKSSRRKEFLRKALLDV